MRCNAIRDTLNNLWGILCESLSVFVYCQTGMNSTFSVCNSNYLIVISLNINLRNGLWTCVTERNSMLWKTYYPYQCLVLLPRTVCCFYPILGTPHKEWKPYSRVHGATNNYPYLFFKWTVLRTVYLNSSHSIGYWQNKYCARFSKLKLRVCMCLKVWYMVL